MAGTFFCTNSEYLFIHRCVCVYIKKMAYLCTDNLHISCRRNTQYVMLRQVTVHVKGRNGDNGGSLQDSLAPASGAHIMGAWSRVGKWVREESRASWQCVSSEWFVPRQVGPSSSSPS